MRQFVLLSLLTSALSFSAFCQTATDFTANDCSGNPHHLFAELDAGKVIVISFVEPCGACIGPSLSAQSTVQSYSATNPGQVLFYVSDDIGNTPCGTLSSWATTNGMGSVPVFSDASIHETDYGTIGMPKIVVVAGTSHHVYFTQDNGLNTVNLKSAINSALATLSVPQNKAEVLNLSLFPNPVKDHALLTYSLAQASNVTAELYNIIGSRIMTVSAGKQPAGNHELPLTLSSATGNGVYFLKLTADETSTSFRFILDK